MHYLVEPGAAAVTEAVDIRSRVLKTGTPFGFNLSLVSDNKSNQSLATNVRRVAVLGAGTMGHGIAQVAAAAGYEVVMRDVNPDAVARGLQTIERNLEKGIQRGKMTEQERRETLQRVRGTVALEEIRDADLVIEAAPENLDLKQSLLREAESTVNEDFIFATNTSSLSITEIASASRIPAKVVGMHFFNPVHIMKLLEIVIGKQTSPATEATVLDVGRRMKKEPIVVRDAPGFASSRLGVTL